MLKDWNRREVNKGEVFYFKNSLRPFITIDNTAEDDLFLDINEMIVYSLDDLDYEKLYFYEKEDDEDFKGVKIAGKIEWVD